jgi:putative heme-binding domain-containing protein
VNGGEYGWRSGTGKWPASYPDSLPATVDVGLSSPTGVKFGTKSNFPEKYRRAFFIADWNYGKIFATHLAADGASYTGTFETFVSGRPLAVTDIEFGSDGAMYFIIGGWKLQSGLYRVSYVGEHGAAAAHAETAGAKTGPDADAQVLRRRLESFHGHRDPAAIGSAWPHLNSPDRWIRYAARIAIESQEPAQWRQRALDETRVDASLTALLALARCGNSSDQPELLERLRRLAEVHLTGSQSLDALRVLQLCFIRLGRPDAETASAVSEVLNGLYPAPTDALNRELSNLLAYLDAPDIVEKTLPLMSSPTASQEQQMHYAFVLRTVKHGWTPEKRRTYFSWFNQALRDFKGGNSLLPYLRNIRTEAASGLSDAERADLAAILEPPRAFAAPLPPPRPFVREWHLEDIQPDLDSVGGKRSMEHGRQAFAAAQCLACHRLGKDGGAVGPDLTGVSRRFNRHDLLENILLPSKIISDRYQTLTIRTRDGEDASGFLVGETAEKLALIVNPLTGQQTEIAKKDIVSRAVATVSTMPEGLLNSLSKEEILDLLAFIEADGKKAE